MPKLYMMKGLPGSGKTTRSFSVMEQSKTPVKRINKDDLREMVDRGTHSHAKEELILKTRDMLVSLYLDQGYDVIVDDTNLGRKHEPRLRQLAREHDAAFTIIDLTDVPLETCIKNDLKRTRSVGERVITEMYNRYILPTQQETYVATGTRPAYLFDLDGTLADLSHRSPYDTAKCLDDAVREPVRNVLVALAATNTVEIVIVSGRKDTYRDLTEQWLQANEIPYHALFMRKAHDNRGDDVVKREIFNTHIRDTYAVMGVFDDRPRVIREWKRLGLTVFDVGPQVEF